MTALNTMTALRSFMAPRTKGLRTALSPQALKVLEHMEVTGEITNVEAHMVLKCRSVSRRITELQDAGFWIDKEWKRDSQGQKYLRYKLVD